MSRPAIERVFSAFKTYRRCAYKKEEAQDNRRYYDRRSSWGIAAHNDRYAKEWQRWDRRERIVIEWFWKHFCKEEGK